MRIQIPFCVFLSSFPVLGVCIEFSLFFAFGERDVVVVFWGVNLLAIFESNGDGRKGQTTNDKNFRAREGD
jgi:hypothetical protein